MNRRRIGLWCHSHNKKTQSSYLPENNKKRKHKSFTDARIANKCPKAVKSPRNSRYHEVSAILLLLNNSQAICSPVNLWMTAMGPPQWGHSQPGWSSGFVGFDIWSDWALAPINSLHSGNNAALRRFAMYPKKRMRTKPWGRTCNKKRRRNSSTDTVISFSKFPWA